MRLPWLDLLLTVLIVIGGYYAWQSGSERGRLQAEHARLKALTGILLPTDPTKIYVQAIETGDPLHFAWRVYLPPQYQLKVRHTRGSSSSGSNSEAVHAIFRVRLRKVDGTWLSYHRFVGGSGMSSLDPDIGKFLEEHADQLQVEQLGREKTVDLDPASGFTLLRVTVPDTALEEPGEDSSGNRRRLKEPVVEVQIGLPDES